MNLNEFQKRIQRYVQLIRTIKLLQRGIVELLPVDTVTIHQRLLKSPEHHLARDFNLGRESLPFVFLEPTRVDIHFKTKGIQIGDPPGFPINFLHPLDLGKHDMIVILKLVPLVLVASDDGLFLVRDGGDYCGFALLAVFIKDPEHIPEINKTETVQPDHPAHYKPDPLRMAVIADLDQLLPLKVIAENDHVKPPQKLTRNIPIIGRYLHIRIQLL